jgi:hypothetical protein
MKFCQLSNLPQPNEMKRKGRRKTGQRFLPERRVSQYSPENGKPWTMKADSCSRATDRCTCLQCGEVIKLRSLLAKGPAGVDPADTELSAVVYACRVLGASRRANGVFYTKLPNSSLAEKKVPAHRTPNKTSVCVVIARCQGLVAEWEPSCRVIKRVPLLRPPMR